MKQKKTGDCSQKTFNCSFTGIRILKPHFKIFPQNYVNFILNFLASGLYEKEVYVIFLVMDAYIHDRY